MSAKTIPSHQQRYQRRAIGGDPASAISPPISGGATSYDLIVGHHVVPYIRLVDCTEAWSASPPADSAEWADEAYRLQKAAVENGERIFDMVLDGRFAVTVVESEVEHWAWFFANAMAVSAGYTSHGEHSRPINRHGPSRV